MSDWLTGDYIRAGVLRLALSRFSFCLGLLRFVVVLTLIGVFEQCACARQFAYLNLKYSKFKFMWISCFAVADLLVKTDSRSIWMLALTLCCILTLEKAND